MHRGRADKAQDRFVHPVNGGLEAHAIAHHRRGINPTDLNAVQEAVVGDVIHHQTDFVGVPTHRHCAGGIFIANRREAVPIRVVPKLVGPLTGVVGPQLLPLTFKSGGAGRVEEGSEERKRF